MFFNCNKQCYWVILNLILHGFVASFPEQLICLGINVFVDLYALAILSIVIGLKSISNCRLSTKQSSSVVAELSCILGFHANHVFIGSKNLSAVPMSLP